MPDENPTRVGAGDYASLAWIAERAIVLQLLRDDHDPCWTRPELEVEISDVSHQAVVVALTYLSLEGVVELEEEAVRASRCVRHLDDLELIAV